MAAVLEEFKRNWPIYVIFQLAGATLGLVNKLEGSFARTLVECQTPLQNTTFTGSRWCGDRLLVIDDGQHLSSVAQSQESLSKVVAMVFVAVLCDVVGRRPAVVLGLACTAASVAMFLLATYMPAWAAHKLFIGGQTLQGFFAADLLAQIITTDVMNEPGVDKLLAGKVSMMAGMLAQAVVQLSALLLNSLELQNFMPIWLGLLVVNVPLTVIAALYCKETRPAGVGEMNKGFLQAAAEEVVGYGQLLATNNFMRMLLLAGACAAGAEAVSSIEQSFYMAHLGASQARVAFVWWLETVFFVYFLGATDKVRERIGVRKTWIVMFCSRGGLDLVLWPLLPLHFLVLPVKKYSKAFWSGAGGFQDAVTSGYFESTVRVKYLAMRKLAEHAASVLAFRCYGSLFDAKTESYIGRLAPFTFQVVLRAMQFCIIYMFCWDAGSAGGISQSLQRLAEESPRKSAPSS
eukprot:1144104-Amphidinium_carterae.1